MKTPTDSLHPTPSYGKGLTGQLPYKLKKRLKTYFSTELGISFVIAALSVIIITLILGGRYWSIDVLSQADISNHDIYATKMLKVEDKDATRQLRYEARQLIAPIYKKPVGAERQVMERMVELLEDVSALRNRQDLALEAKLEALKDLLNSSDRVSPKTLQVVLQSPHWPHIYEVSIDVAEALVTRGVTSEDFRLRKDLLILKEVTPNKALSSSEKDAVALLVATRLRPTLVIDDVSTEAARDIASSHVKPVVETFNKGDLVVKKGERITHLQREALKRQGIVSSRGRWLSLIGISILSVSLLSIVWGYLYRFEHSNFFKPAYCGLLATTMVLCVGGLTLLLDWAPSYMSFYPVAIFALTISIFTHPRIAILNIMILLLLCGLVLKIPLDSLSVLIVGSMMGIFVLARKPVPKDRNDLLIAGLGVGMAQGIALLAISFLYEPIINMEQVSLLYQVVGGIFSGIIGGIFTLGILPYVESFFKLVTSYTLLELANHDRPILRRMQMEAPGTFHHSLMVATLAEAAAETIGANPILTRVGAIYHDIGKLKRPLFFVENQAYFGVENPHDKLTPRLSKMVITAHPRDGIEMAKQLGLPKVIMRFMPEHHGTLVAGYFYNKAVLQEGEENVNKAQFRYPGPKPQSKETAIVMIADACESAVRALKNPTVAQVEERVDKIIKQRVDDGQFSECPITFQDIQQIRDTFVRILRGIQHNRIEYQQNILQELGRKSTQEVPKPQMPAITLPETALSQVSGESGISATAVKLEPVLDLDALAELQHQEPSSQATASSESDEPETGCC